MVYPALSLGVNERNMRVYVTRVCFTSLCPSVSSSGLEGLSCRAVVIWSFFFGCVSAPLGATSVAFKVPHQLAGREVLLTDPAFLLTALMLLD